MLIYLASPYSHRDATVRQQRFETVCRITSRLIQEGHLIFSPIAHSHPIAVAGGLPLSFDFWLSFDRRMLRLCDELWIAKIDGWEESIGIQHEIRLAETMGMPVKFIEVGG